MSLKRLVETRMGETLKKEHDNTSIQRGEYWHAFEKSIFQWKRLFKNKKIILFGYKNYLFPVIMDCITDHRELLGYV